MLRLQLHMSARGIYRRGSPRFHLIICLIEKRLRGVHLRFRGFDARRVRDGLQILEAHGEDDEVARIFVCILRGLEALRRRTLFIDRLPVKHRLCEIRACVKIGKRTDDGRDRESGNMQIESELGQVHLRHVHVRRGVHMRQESA